ncbi:hypothetical protein [Chryseobacterium binzhouense]|jgi:hypothetical protein|uniref:hypothetical protein n=1 Tax=Chryseobacterium binzhouense TaxID=2593646 RepID=UPI00117FEA1F|nr:hypothetical protein [Chryseobacterium binzhouense]
MKNNYIKIKFLVSGLILATASLSSAQVRIVNTTTLQEAVNSSAFIDASSNFTLNETPNIGKGMLFPRTDLSRFTSFGGAPIGIGNSYPTRYDGLIVYNIKDGGKAGVGATEGELKPGFWFYENKSTTTNGGTWKQISSPTTNLLTIAGATLTSTVNGVTSTVTLPAANSGVDNPANNGLSKDGTTVQLGGSLLKDTSIELNDKSLNFTGAQGKIGVGTNNPLSKFNIQGGALSIGDLTNYSGGLQVVNQNADRAIMRVYSSNNTERFTIQENGNIGIGTNNPTRKLHIDGNIRIENMIEGDVNNGDRVLAIAIDGNVKSVAVNEILNSEPRFINAGNIEGERVIAEGVTNLIDGAQINVTVPANTTYKVVVSGNAVVQHPVKVNDPQAPNFTYGSGQFQLRVNGSTVATVGTGFSTRKITELNPTHWQSTGNATTLNHVIEINNTSGSPITRTINVHYWAKNTTTGLANKNHQAFFKGTFQTYRMP